MSANTCSSKTGVSRQPQTASDYIDFINLLGKEVLSAEEKQRLGNFRFQDKIFRDLLATSPEASNAFYNRVIFVHLHTDGIVGHVSLTVPVLSADGKVIKTKFYIGLDPKAPFDIPVKAVQGGAPGLAFCAAKVAKEIIWLAGTGTPGAIFEQPRTTDAKHALTVPLHVTEERYKETARLMGECVQNPPLYNVRGCVPGALNYVFYAYTLLQKVGFVEGLRNVFSRPEIEKLGSAPVLLQMKGFDDEPGLKQTVARKLNPFLLKNELPETNFAELEQNWKIEESKIRVEFQQDQLVTVELQRKTDILQFLAEYNLDKALELQKNLVPLLAESLKPVNEQSAEVTGKTSREAPLVSPGIPLSIEYAPSRISHKFAVSLRAGSYNLRTNRIAQTFLQIKRLGIIAGVTSYYTTNAASRLNFFKSIIAIACLMWQVRNRPTADIDENLLLPNAVTAGVGITWVLSFLDDLRFCSSHDIEHFIQCYEESERLLNGFAIVNNSTRDIPARHELKPAREHISQLCDSKDFSAYTDREPLAFMRNIGAKNQLLAGMRQGCDTLMKALDDSFFFIDVNQFEQYAEDIQSLIQHLESSAFKTPQERQRIPKLIRERVQRLCVAKILSDPSVSWDRPPSSNDLAARYKTLLQMYKHCNKLMKKYLPKPQQSVEKQGASKPHAEKMPPQASASSRLTPPFYALLAGVYRLSIDILASKTTVSTLPPMMREVAHDKQWGGKSTKPPSQSISIEDLHRRAKTLKGMEQAGNTNEAQAEFINIVQAYDTIHTQHTFDQINNQLRFWKLGLHVIGKIFQQKTSLPIPLTSKMLEMHAHQKNVTALLGDLKKLKGRVCATSRVEHMKWALNAHQDLKKEVKELAKKERVTEFELNEITQDVAVFKKDVKHYLRSLRRIRLASLAFNKKTPLPVKAPSLNPTSANKIEENSGRSGLFFRLFDGITNSADALIKWSLKQVVMETTYKYVEENSENRGIIYHVDRDLSYLDFYGAKLSLSYFENINFEKSNLVRSHMILSLFSSKVVLKNADVSFACMLFAKTTEGEQISRKWLAKRGAINTHLAITSLSELYKMLPLITEDYTEGLAKTIDSIKINIISSECLELNPFRTPETMFLLTEAQKILTEFILNKSITL